MPELTIIVPAYNEETSIADVVRGTRQAFEGIDVEVLVVDDASTDQTVERATAVGARVIRHRYNKGNGAAVKSGLRHANADLGAVIDADGQHRPQDLRKLFDQLADTDMVVGTRVKPTYSITRRLGNAVLNRVASYLSGHRVRDLTSGLRVFRVSTVMQYMGLYPNGFSFPSTSTLALLTDGYSVSFVTIEADSRAEGGESSIRPIRDGVKFLAIIVRIVHLFHPLKLYLPLGGLLLLGGVAWSIRTIVVAYQFSAGAILLLLAGLIVTLMGFQIDQVAALRRQMGRDGR
ncbi:MAG: glycosyltransferase family 2 protein [Acidobacteriota bacterium]|nr:glycosyltransferase family 2 protein [Acidobacteriota bacterium]MDH3786832.1 glycosyltransferase family 2 protein [Acidobacteriota bacterium]